MYNPGGQEEQDVAPVDCSERISRASSNQIVKISRLESKSIPIN